MIKKFETMKQSCVPGPGRAIRDKPVKEKFLFYDIHVLMWILIRDKRDDRFLSPPIAIVKLSSSASKCIQCLR